MNVRDTSVSVVGLAKSGISAALLLRERGADVRATDAKTASALGEDAVRRLEEAGVRMFLGGHPREAIAGAKLVVTSPGVPENALPLAQARDEKIETIGELELAWRLLPAGTTVVAITGSNGKSTTTSLTGHLLKSAGVDAWVGGNLGLPFSELIRSGKAPRVAIVEVSSFMLETAPTFKPRIGAILNISPNHLDRHPSLEVYAALKARIWRNADDRCWTVFNEDDPIVSALAQKAPGRRIGFRRGNPSSAGGAGYVAEHETRDVLLGLPGSDVVWRMYLDDDFPCPGDHNLANAAAAALMAFLTLNLDRSVQDQRDEVYRGLDMKWFHGFKALEHRLERCGAKNGVTFYNDSKATTTTALATSIAVFDKSIVLAGGKDKGGDWRSLREAFKERVRRVVTFGAARDLIASALEGTTDVRIAQNLPAAFSIATEDLVPGDVVLFSPGCASYDQFANFEERGHTFKALVKGWIG